MSMDTDTSCVSSKDVGLVMNFLLGLSKGYNGEHNLGKEQS